MNQLPCEKPTLFKGCHFNHLLIIQAVRWYVTYKLSYRDVCDLMAERGVTVVHTTVLRWVQWPMAWPRRSQDQTSSRASLTVEAGHHVRAWPEGTLLLVAYRIDWWSPSGQTKDAKG